MKKPILFLVLLCAAVTAYSEGRREISLLYQHSMRIPHNVISIKLTESNGYCQAEIVSRQMQGKQGFEQSEINKTVQLEKTYFDKLYEDLTNLNFREILASSNSVGSDGVNISIAFGSRQCSLTLTVWSPDYKTEERNLRQLNGLLLDLFAQTGLGEWY